MKLVAAAVLLTACAANIEMPAPPDPQHDLANDAYYSGIVPPYASPDDCVANESNVHACTYELAFCRTGGKAGIRTNDIITEGTFTFDGSADDGGVLDGSFVDGTLIHLVMRDGHATGGVLANWVADTEGLYETLEWDVVSCDP